MSEIQQAKKPKDLLEADFTLENLTASSQEVSLVGKSCSCYGVLLDQAPLAINESATIPATSSKLLTFDVAPPSTASEKSWLVSLVNGDDPAQELKLSLRVRVYADVRLEPDAFVTSLPPASLHRSAPGTELLSSTLTKHRLVIRRTWRGDERNPAAPTLTGLPAGWGYSPPVVRETPREVDDGLWQQSWETDLELLAVTSFSGEQPQTAAVGDRQVRLKVQQPEGDAVQTPGDGRRAAPSPGVYRYRVSFLNDRGNSMSAQGRIVLNEPPGITAPVVVHWGQLKVGVSRKRRIMLSANDQRPFTISSATLKDRPSSEQDVPARHPREEAVESQTSVTSPATDNSPASETGGRLWHLNSSTADFTFSRDADQPRALQSVELIVTPLHAGPIDETITIETDHPLTPEIEIRLRALVMEAAASEVKSADD